ncbi:MAG: SMC-Scp complex subunit ScpB [Bdellovibrionota bacterium]
MGHEADEQVALNEQIEQEVISVDAADSETEVDSVEQNYAPESQNEEAASSGDASEQRVELSEGEGSEDGDQSDGDLAADAALLPLSAQLGSLLFVSPKPLTVETLAELTREQPEAVEIELERLKESFTEELHGFVLQEIAGAWQLRTVPGAARVVQRLIPPRARRLSRAAAETLAVIAYKQPVQRAEIEAIRGVDALPTLRTLIDARLIRIVGRESSPGQPALYGTTNVFLEKFGLRDLSELPTVREILELAKEPGEAVNEEESDTAENLDADQEGEPSTAPINGANSADSASLEQAELVE